MPGSHKKWVPKMPPLRAIAQPPLVRVEPPRRADAPVCQRCGCELPRLAAHIAAANVERQCRKCFGIQEGEV